MVLTQSYPLTQNSQSLEDLFSKFQNYIRALAGPTRAGYNHILLSCGKLRNYMMEKRDRERGRERE